MRNKLAGKVALVTGGSRGLGKGIALELANAGADVAINFRRNEPEAEKVRQSIAAMGRQAMTIAADVGEARDVKAMFDAVIARFGKIDILVNNAGTTKSQNIFETAEEDWDFIIRTNLKSCFLCSKAAMEHMREARGGTIINISSIVAHRGALYGHVHYAATKSGLLGFTKTLALTAAPYGITVNCIAPGIIETELLFETHGQKEVEKLAASVPLGLGRVRDVGLAAVYLAGEGGRYITGATLDINGGMYLR
jgi:NAD(P)-dependent dehydrogenase (short-subunit alcohol dehydrogenase family)